MVQKNKDEIKSLLDSREELRTAMRTALGKELSEEIKSIVAEATEKIQKNVAANRTIDVDTINLKSVVTLKVKYNGTEQVNNFVVKDVIPKSFANAASKITVTAPGATVNVTNPDPEYVFVYSNVAPGAENTVTYSVNERVFTIAGEYAAPVILAGSTQVYVAPTTTTIPANVTTTTLAGSVPNNTLVFVIAIVLILAGVVWYYYQNYAKKPAWQPVIRGKK